MARLTIKCPTTPKYWLMPVNNETSPKSNQDHQKGGIYEQNNRKSEIKDKRLQLRKRQAIVVIKFVRSQETHQIWSFLHLTQQISRTLRMGERSRWKLNDGTLRLQAPIQNSPSKLRNVSKSTKGSTRQSISNCQAKATEDNWDTKSTDALQTLFSCC